jgi:tetratricopeptide (TPR) repeat protein
MMRRWILTVLLLLVGQWAFGQLHPERREVRRGNRAWEREDYTQAEGRYLQALEKAPASVEANFNLGDVFYRQGRFEEAEPYFGQAASFSLTPEQAGEALYNQAGAQVRQYRSTYDRQKLTGALEACKQSLRLNPDDPDAKFNLAYIQKLLESEPGGTIPILGRTPDESEGDSQGGGQQPPPERGISPQEAERMLEALENNEERARDAMEGEPARAAERTGKNW